MKPGVSTMSTTATLSPPAATTAPSLTDAVARCRQEQQRWQALSVRERLRPVARLRRLLVEECDALCAAVRADIGKPIGEALAGDVLPTADACKFLEKQARAILKPRRVSWRVRPLWLFGQGDTVHRRARGVVGII